MLPTYAFWKFDDFSWGDTRKAAGDTKKGGHGEHEGEFDSSKITMKRWAEFERERRTKSMYYGHNYGDVYSPGMPPGQHGYDEYYSDA